MFPVPGVWCAILICLLLVCSRYGASDEFPGPAVWCQNLDQEVAAKFPACQEVNGGSKEDDPDSEPTSHVDAEGKVIAEKLPDNEVMTSKTLFEGDILGMETTDSENAVALQANAIKNELRHWPDATVAYKISSSFRPKDRKKIEDAIQIFNKKTCMKFRPYSGDEEDFIYIASGLGCSSYVGRAGNKQVLSLQVPACLKPGIIQHELMHAVGFYHEQARTDRDEYVEINWNNIRRGDVNQFRKYTDAEVTAFGEPYDYNSVMHYGRFDFAIDREEWTIRPLTSRSRQGLINMGQRDGFSDIDIKKIKALYKCPAERSPCGRGWIQSGRRCYFLSFQTNEKKRSFVGARNYCRQNGALISSASGDGALNLIVKTITDSDDNVQADDPVWLSGCQVISSEVPSVQDTDDCSQLSYFICEKPLVT